MIAIQYVGKKPRFRDVYYGTGLTWRQDETLLVADEVAARKLLSHPEFEEGKTDGARMPETSEVSSNAATNPSLENPVEAPPLVNLESMGKQQLSEFAHRHFNVKFQAKDSLAKMRETIRLQMGRQEA